MISNNPHEQMDAYIRQVERLKDEGLTVEQICERTPSIPDRHVKRILRDLSDAPKRAVRGKRGKPLSDAQVREIRERFAAGESQRSLAEEFGKNPAAISGLVRGCSRRGAGGPFTFVGSGAPGRGRGTRRAGYTPKISDADVFRVRALSRQGKSDGEICVEMDISVATVRAILFRRGRFKHIENGVW